VRTYEYHQRKNKHCKKTHLIEKYSITINISIVVLIVLRMFRNAITDEIFRRNIQTYLHTQ